ncbi:hypothetical protein GGE16_001521 [Rhizobium leguminosarum]|uniref:Calcineurin-like phosphoesterase domain-containing protein n=1 Tax=Rhizobium leguminosarum TaxID=384 RepID=A0AAE2MHN0_RHILE|nr:MULTISPECIES: metallophosphoesterase [Rhizobium]MBB4289505.1 hypothetical protein [Rhizobium leguminosarum]MBB4294399.1 hypothetical protein [Rhizobium leguminosarum]MBB4305795.1 hypothetical protein [Rhizobium leguminosarum]MBB4418628.1 hypothetical protein [Rhizobium leguminosarum]MBB4433472.1 hypothetical protein [Rhizobium esperanzae]
MKAWIFSDLHLEFPESRKQLDVPAADICICAGDILDGGVAPSVRWLGENVSKKMPVVFVPGNHEYYRASLVEGFAAGLEESKNFPGVFVLDCGLLSLDGIRFLGATLWSDFALLGDPRIPMMEAEQGLNDYRLIKLSKRPFKKFSARQAMGRHFEARLLLAHMLATETQETTVVVTHYAPSILSVPRDRIDDPLTPSFASRLERTILTYQPRLWIHGHIHTPSNYLIGSTRVICNPRGYPDELSPAFRPDLVIDVNEYSSTANRSFGSVFDDADVQSLSRKRVPVHARQRPM